MADDVLSIYSTRAIHGDEPACRLEWRGQEWFASATAVRQTAEDLFTCAAYADLVGQLLRIGVETSAIAAITSAALRDRRPAYFGTPTTVHLLPAGSSADRSGVVLISRRNRFGPGKNCDYLTPDEARTMGRVWLQGAEASDQDTLFDQVLRRAGWLTETELDATFGLLADIREGKERLTGP